jgi:hypothetical protein
MPTKHELRNQIRGSIGRFKRDDDLSFTNEELAALANAVGYDVDTGRLPKTSVVRAGIRWKTGLSAYDSGNR